MPQNGANGFPTSVVQPIRFAQRVPGSPFGDPQMPPGEPSGFQVAAGIGNLGSIALAWQVEPTYTPSVPVRLLVREDPAVPVPPRPRLAVVPGAAPAPAPTPPATTPKKPRPVLAPGRSAGRRVGRRSAGAKTI